MAAMAIEPGERDFDEWLGGKLRDLNTDDGIFGSYIKGILNGDESNDEKAEALEEIISEITGNDISQICQDILDHWQKAVKSESTVGTAAEDEVETKLVKLLESQSLPTIQQRQYTEEERRVREAILAQYSQIQDQEECDFNDDDERETDNGLEKNTNVASIQQAEREKREQARLDSQKKKDKDKEDREKQKQQQAEKKEKRKTQKSERRR